MLQQPVTLYHKKKKDITLLFEVSKEKADIVYETKISIGEHAEKKIKRIIKNPGGFITNERMLSFFNIIDFVTFFDSIYILYCNFGTLYFDRYTINEELELSKKSLFVGKYHLLSFDNGGTIHSFCVFRLIDDQLFFYLDSFQQFGGGLKGLFQLTDDKVFEIQLDEWTSRRFKILQMTTFGVEYYHQLAQQKHLPSESDALFNILKPFYNQPYSSWKTGRLKNLEAPEEHFLKNIGLKSYDLFYKNDAFIPLENIYITANESLSKILKETKKTNQSIKHLKVVDLIYTGENDLRIYFFYNLPDQDRKIRIAIYSLFQNEWLINQYEKKEVME